MYTQAVSYVHTRTLVREHNRFLVCTQEISCERTTDSCVHTKDFLCTHKRFLCPHKKSLVCGRSPVCTQEISYVHTGEPLRVHRRPPVCTQAIPSMHTIELLCAHTRHFLYVQECHPRTTSSCPSATSQAASSQQVRGRRHGRSLKITDFQRSGPT